MDSIMYINKFQSKVPVSLFISRSATLFLLAKIHGASFSFIVACVAPLVINCIYHFFLLIDIVVDVLSAYFRDQR
jgi:hypothetical protein